MFSFVSRKPLSCILIDIIDDKVVESKETISLVLQPLDSSSGVRISRGLSTVEIIDNDARRFSLLMLHRYNILLIIVESISIITYRYRQWYRKWFYQS